MCEEWIAYIRHALSMTDDGPLIPSKLYRAIQVPIVGSLYSDVVNTTLTVVVIGGRKYQYLLKPGITVCIKILWMSCERA